MRKLLMPIQGDFVAPRFDLATEILIASFAQGELTTEPRTIIMERPSDEGLCQMVVEDNVSDVICGGIEELHYNFLVWKKVNVLDGIIGGWQSALEKLLAGTLRQGEIIPHNENEHLLL